MSITALREEAPNIRTLPPVACRIRAGHESSSRLGQLSRTFAERSEPMQFLIRDWGRNSRSVLTRCSGATGLRLFARRFRGPKPTGQRFVPTAFTECPDKHLERSLEVFVDQNNGRRRHRALSLASRSPEPRQSAATCRPPMSSVFCVVILGGVVHKYVLAA